MNVRACVFRSVLVVVFTSSYSLNALAQVSFSDNFDDGIRETWTFFDTIQNLTGTPHNEIVPENGAVRIDVPPVQNAVEGFAAGGLSHTSSIFTNFEISIDVLEREAHEWGFVGLAARVPELVQGYFVGVSEMPPGSGVGNVNISRGDDDGIIRGLVHEFFDMPEDNQVRIVFRGEGPLLTAEVFGLSNGPEAESLATIQAEDTTFTQGYGSVFASASNAQRFESFANVLVDNFSLTATPAPDLPGALVGDMDMDGTVAFADFLILSSSFGSNVDPPGTGADLDGDGTIGFPDFLLLADNFGATAVATALVPEPSGVLWTAMGFVIFRRRRKLVAE